MKSSKVILNIMSVVCFIYGAFYVFSLVFIPIGIYCFIAGRTFSFKAEHTDDMFTVNNKVFRNYVIFTSIFCLPFGLLSIIPYLLLTSNNVRVNMEYKPNDNATSQAEYENENKVVEAEISQDESLEDRKEKYNKLKAFNEKGLITDEELEDARKRLFGDNK